jgi:hypothetical protein
VSDKNSVFPLMISVVVMDAAQLTGVYALLGGTAHAALSAGKEQRRPSRRCCEAGHGEQSSGPTMLAQENRRRVVLPDCDDRCIPF